MNKSWIGSDCADYVGDFYDPTHQCPSFSGSEYCYNSSYLCNDTSYAYDCDFDNDRYSCAPGDFSGKFGMIPNTTSRFTYFGHDTDTLNPRGDDMIGMMMAIYCGDNDSGISYLACAPVIKPGDFITTTTTTMTPTVDPTHFPTSQPTDPTFIPTGFPTADPTGPTTSPTSAPTGVTTYVATFGGSNGIIGSVTIDNGYVIVDLNMSAEPDLPINFSYCTSGGMKYHIHMKWNHTNDTDRIGSTQCGADYTGGHWDPWHGMFTYFVHMIYLSIHCIIYNQISVFL